MPTAMVATATEEIRVDGALDEAAWAAAVPVTDFVRYLPAAGGAPAGTTEVRFLQDAQALYVGMRVRDAGYEVRARVSPREDINSDDQIGVYLDTFHDGRSGYVFYLNPLGIQQDARASATEWSMSWDTALRSTGRVDDDGQGYTIELAIPWRSIKYPAGDPVQTWGVILTRKIPGEGAKYGFPVLERDHPALFSQAADLVGVRPANAGSGLELVPSVTVAQEWGPDTNPDYTALDLDPWWRAVRPSLDLRLGLAPDLGLAAAVNPDFSQVESDVADVRLNAIDAFQYPEQRPFFLDGIDAYQDRQGTLYTRSIADPVYGLKVTGREDRTSVGVMHALDRDPLPSFHREGTPGFDADDVEGAVASDTFARLRLDAFRSGLVGLVLADKRILGGATYDAFGLDATVPFGDRWVVGGSVQESLVQGPEGHLLGVSGEAGVARRSGVGTGVSLQAGGSTPGYREEMGFQTLTGLADGYVTLDHTFTPSRGLDTIAPFTGAYAREEVDGDHLREGWAGLNAQGGPHDVWAEVALSEQREQGALVDGWAASIGGGTQAGSVLELYPAAGLGRGLDYGTLGPATWGWAELQASIRATVATRLDLTGSATRHLPDGLDPETATLARARLNWQFTRPLGARWIVQHDRVIARDGTTEGLLLSTLVSFLTVPGTAAYVGWTERVDLLDGDTVDRVVFAKASLLLRP